MAPSAERLRLNAGELSDFLSYQVVEIGEMRSIGCGNAAGVRGATAPIIALPKITRTPLPNGPKPLFELMARSGPPSAP